MKRNLRLLVALPILTLAVGIAIGNAVARPTVVETDVIPAPSLKHTEMAQSFCVRSTVFADLSKHDGREQKRFVANHVWVTPVSDRGAICTVEGVQYTKQGFSETAVVSEPLQTTFLVAITGESEVVTEEFAKALASSPVAKAMASNIGNDGTVVPKVKIIM